MDKKLERGKRGPVKGVPLEQVQRTDFGKRLFEIRRARGISQSQLGEMVGLSFRMISYYERDKNGPPVAILKKIAHELNVTASYLLGESPLKTTIRDDVEPSIKKTIDLYVKLPKKHQKAVANMIKALSEKDDDENK